MLVVCLSVYLCGGAGGVQFHQVTLFSFLTALKMAAGGGLGGGGGNPIWSLVWCLALIFIAFPVAGFCAWLYILILPFSVCVDGLTVRDIKYKCRFPKLTWTHRVTHTVTCVSREALPRNTPGTAGGPGGRDRTLALKSQKPLKK